MAMVLALLLAASFATRAYSAAEDPNNRFLNPVNGNGENIFDRSLNPVFELGTRVVIKWTSTVTGPYLVSLWQQDLVYDKADNLTVVYSTTSGSGEQSFEWPVPGISVDLGVSNIFFLWLHAADKQITSRYFNITRPFSNTRTSSSVSTLSTITSSLVSSTASTTGATIVDVVNSVSTSATATASSAVSSQTPTSSSSVALQTQVASDSSGPSSKLVLGVGLGVGIPLVILAAICALLLLLRRRRRQQQPLPGNDATNIAETPPEIYEKQATYRDEKKSELATFERVIEAPTTREPVELPNEGYR